MSSFLPSNHGSLWWMDIIVEFDNGHDSTEDGKPDKDMQHSATSFIVNMQQAMTPVYFDTWLSLPILSRRYSKKYRFLTLAVGYWH